MSKLSSRQLVTLEVSKLHCLFYFHINEYKQSNPFNQSLFTRKLITLAHARPYQFYCFIFAVHRLKEKIAGSAIQCQTRHINCNKKKSNTLAAFAYCLWIIMHAVV